jgi:DHA1 family tetracycline resistance protein-like MFS transporter
MEALNPFKPLGWAFNFTALLPLIAIFVIMNFVGTMYGTVWAMFSQDMFAWNGLMIGLSLGAFGFFHAGAQALLTGPAAARLGERWALVLGIGMPALQSLTTRQVDADNQGKLQGVLASLVSLSAVFGPLFFSSVYFLLKPTWPGLIWIVGGGVYLLALPLLLGLRKTATVTVTPELGPS